LLDRILFPDKLPDQEERSPPVRKNETCILQYPSLLPDSDYGSKQPIERWISAEKQNVDVGRDRHENAQLLRDRILVETRRA
jgi:hypothetical protein